MSRTEAHKLAIEGKHVTTDLIEATEFRELSQRPKIYGVPRTVINESMEVEGAVPEASADAANWQRWRRSCPSPEPVNLGATPSIVIATTPTANTRGVRQTKREDQVMIDGISGQCLIALRSPTSQPVVGRATPTRDPVPGETRQHEYLQTDSR